MPHFLISVLLIGVLSTEVLAGAAVDSVKSVSPFEQLVNRMRLKTPKLGKDEYEVRIWNKQALRFGDAQMLYVLTKTKKRFSLNKYIIESNRQGFKYATQLKPPHPVDTRLWERLVQQDVLTLPDQSALHDQLFPKPRKDSAWNVIEVDGSVSVKAKRWSETSVIISDGEGYVFEIFSYEGYRHYSYSNPREYREHKPQIVELRKVVTILNELAVAFQSTQ